MTPPSWCGLTAVSSLNRIASAPREIKLHSRNPARHVTLDGTAISFAPVSGPPHVMDLAGGRRVGTLVDYANGVRLCQAFEVIQVLGAFTEPQDIRGRVPAARDAARATDIVRQDPAYLLSRPRPGGGLLRTGAYCLWPLGAGVPRYAVHLHHHQHEFAACAGCADGRWHHRLRARRPGANDHAFYARRCDGAGHDRRRTDARPRGNARRPGSRTDLPAGCTGGLRQFHLQCRHEVRITGIRHAGVLQGPARRRSDGALRGPAVAIIECHRLERARRPRGLRVADESVGRALRRGELRVARRRLAGEADCPRATRSSSWTSSNCRCSPKCCSPWARRTTISRSTAIVEAGPGGHFFGPNTPWRATGTPSIRRWSPTGATIGAWSEDGAKTATERAAAIWRSTLDAFTPPPLDPAIAAGPGGVPAAAHRGRRLTAAFLVPGAWAPSNLVFESPPGGLFA